MKKLLATLIAAVVMAAGLVAFNAGPASAQEYPGTLPVVDNAGRDTSAGTPRVNGRPIATVQYRAENGRNIAGRVRMSVRKIGSRQIQVRSFNYRYQRKIAGPVFNGPGRYQVTIIFTPWAKSYQTRVTSYITYVAR